MGGGDASAFPEDFAEVLRDGLAAKTGGLHRDEAWRVVLGPGGYGEPRLTEAEDVLAQDLRTVPNGDQLREEDVAAAKVRDQGLDWRFVSAHRVSAVREGR